jgi:hypothetical protein
MNGEIPPKESGELLLLLLGVNQSAIGYMTSLPTSLSLRIGSFGMTFMVNSKRSSSLEIQKLIRISIKLLRSLKSNLEKLLLTKRFDIGTDTSATFAGCRNTEGNRKTK